MKKNSTLILSALAGAFFLFKNKRTKQAAVILPKIKTGPARESITRGGGSGAGNYIPPAQPTQTGSSITRPRTTTKTLITSIKYKAPKQAVAGCVYNY